MNKKLHIPGSQKNLHISINLLSIRNVSTGNKLLELHVSENMIKINLYLCYLISIAPNRV